MIRWTFGFWGVHQFILHKDIEKKETEKQKKTRITLGLKKRKKERKEVYTSFPISQIAFIASRPTAGAMKMDRAKEIPANNEPI